MSSSELDRILAFLREIGLPTRESIVEGESFLPGIRIVRGELQFERARLLSPGDLLHEAGHLALMPAARRHELDGDVKPEQHYPHAGEVEAIAWSYAAALHLGVSIETLFHADGYRGQSAGLRLAYSLGVYPGVAGLVHLGLAANSGQALEGIARYPQMLQWLRD